MSASRSRLRVDARRPAWRLGAGVGAGAIAAFVAVRRRQRRAAAGAHAARGAQRAGAVHRRRGRQSRHRPARPRSAARRTATAAAQTTASARRRRPRMRDIARQYSLTLVSEWPIEQLQMHCVLFRIPPGTTREAMIEKLQDRQARAHRAAAQRIRIRPRRRGFDDPYARLQSNVSALDVVEAHAFSRGAGIRVAIIDTGVDTQHPDLAGRTQLTRNYIDDDDVDVSQRPPWHAGRRAHRGGGQQRHRHRGRRARRPAPGVQGLLAGLRERAPAAAIRSPSRRRSPTRSPRRRRSST